MQFISIHAPTWGATKGVRGYSGQMTDFNPRTHVGCDYLCNVNKKGRHHFNPRTHVGCDRADTTPDARECHFNPRTHVGCDDKLHLFFFVITISIHAPTWGATNINYLEDRLNEISIHAPTWGATVKPSNGWLLGHKDNEFANENIIIINSVNIT